METTIKNGNLPTKFFLSKDSTDVNWVNFKTWFCDRYKRPESFFSKNNDDYIFSIDLSKEVGYSVMGKNNIKKDDKLEGYSELTLNEFNLLVNS